MRIKLINPRFHSRYFWDFAELSRVMDRKANNFLLALPTLAGLTPAKHEVILVDDNIAPPDFDEPVDLVGLTGMTCYINRAFEIADEYRRRGVPVVFGGPHATLAPYEALEHADAVVIGEAEHVWEQLLEDFENGCMKEVYRGVDDKPTMKANPPPRWDLVDERDYCFYGVEATRGCPFDCHFCSIKQIYGKDFRTRTPDEVIAELKVTPNNQIFFTDDNLIGNMPFCRELFAKMKGMDLSWGCQMSINVAFMPDMLELMRDCGCFFIFIGLETLNKDAVEAMNKPVNRLDYYKAVENIQTMGMHVIGSFIVGTDDCTLETFDEIAEYVAVSKQSWLMVNIMNSPPGTVQLRTMEDEGRNIVYSYDELDGAHATVKHPTMSREEIEEGFRNLYRQVYDWTAMRKRFSWSLDNGEWAQSALTLSAKEQARIGARLFKRYVVNGSWPQRRFFFSMVRRGGKTVNKNTIINILLLALNWNEFAYDLKPRVMPTGDPIVFRKEYMTPVEDQTLGKDGLPSGVERELPRMIGIRGFSAPGGSSDGAAAAL
jgi:radical SAM superfamily enzyme YgiQ (UPF0313 family)